MSLDFSLYDQRRYPTVDVREGYRRWAPSYEDGMTGDLDLWLLERLETVAWDAERVVDLACGTGRTGAWLAARGARHIDGVDLTPEMLEGARARAIYAALHCEDIRQTSLPDRSADLVVNVMSVEHLSDLAPFYAEVARLCRPGGTAVVIGYHPHFLLSGIPTHFPVDGAQLAIENTVHLFSDHMRAATANGFALRELQERVVDDEMYARLGWRRHLGLPVSYALVWTALDRAAAP